jgi:pyruvate kinase
MSTVPTGFQRAHTKIVATVGPACRAPEQLAALVAAGVDVFRLNMAHGSIEGHEATLRDIRRLGAALQQEITVLVDLGGPKIRLGALVGGQADCQSGATVRFVRGDVSSEPLDLTSTYSRLIDELAVGDRVMLADGTVSLNVTERTADSAVCRVVQPGIVRSRQGINLPGVRLSLPAMSDDDREHARWAAHREIDYISLSFVRDPADILELKTLLREAGSSAGVIAKIEKQEALDRLSEIVLAADGVMVARGDLGVEIDVARMPIVQKEIVALANRLQKPVIIATQMLDSMQRSSYPTRAEVTDVANAILDGCDACMLSGETAVGMYPREAVEMMNRVAVATESLFLHIAPKVPPEILADGLKPVTQAVVFGAGHIARQAKARMMVVSSHSGVTALALSKQRNYITTIGVSDNPAALRKMGLYWGVLPLGGAPTTSTRELLNFVSSWSLRDGCLKPGDRIVLVGGTMSSAGHDLVMVHEVRERDTAAGW